MEYIEIGKIVNTHGIKGEVKIYPYTDDFDNILTLKKLYIDSKAFNISGIKVHKNMFLVKFKNVDTCEAAEMLRDKIIYRELDEKEELEEDTYYIKDLIGMNVILEDGVLFGTLKDVLNTGANDVYVVNSKEHGEVLLPAIKDVVKDINIKERKIIIHLMEGLI